MPIISSSTNVYLMDSATKNYCIYYRKRYNLGFTCAIISKLKLFHETLERSMLLDTTCFSLKASPFTLHQQKWNN